MYRSSVGFSEMVVPSSPAVSRSWHYSAATEAGAPLLQPYRLMTLWCPYASCSRCPSVSLLAGNPTKKQRNHQLQRYRANGTLDCSRRAIGHTPRLPLEEKDMMAICLQAISRSSSISSIAGSAESVPCGNVITANVSVSDFLIPFSLVSLRSSALLLIADKLDSQYVWSCMSRYLIFAVSTHRL